MNMLQRVLITVIIVALAIGLWLSTKQQKEMSDQITNLTSQLSEIKDNSVSGINGVEQENSNNIEQQEEPETTNKDVPTVQGEDNNTTSESSPPSEQDTAGAQSTNRSWALYSKKYTISSSTDAANFYKNKLANSLVYEVTQSDYLGSAIVIQTYLQPHKFISTLFDTNHQDVKYLADVNTSQGYSRELFDGPVESQFWVTEIGGYYIYFTDNFANRGCFISEGEVCMDAMDVMNSIGSK